MKGFMHIVEILLVALLVFMAFTQFSTIPNVSENWSNVKLSIMANDILRALDAKGVDWMNKTELSTELEDIVPENMIYSIVLENVIRPEIKVGCYCDDGELAAVENMIKPKNFAINDENITIEVFQIDDINELFSLEFDVALLYGYEDLSLSPYPLMNFLDKDKGVIEILNPRVIDSTQKGIFGINSSTTNAASSGIKFTDNSKINGREMNKIYDYFFHIPSFYDNFDDLEKWNLNDNGNIHLTLGDPEPSLRLIGATETDFVETRYYRSFVEGDIDFDILLREGGAVFLGFGKNYGYEYLASISATETVGYDSFYRKYPLTSIGSNTSHITTINEWHHIKIVVASGSLELYNDGELVASNTLSLNTGANITISGNSVSTGHVMIDNFRVTHRDSPTFENFLESYENTTQLNDDNNRILLSQLGTNVPACVINYNVEGIGKGRTAWISNSSQNYEKYNTVVKSLILWAAGNRYNIVKADIKNPSNSYIHKVYNKDMFQNVKILLQLGYLY
ncbi:MAG: hypothetical protein KAS04_01835 [Candidatus Aenigmarchaeota archaeon]|nr:hypothetical protein [Candidatus Aenigmarchaeota archaeon]